VEGSANTAVSTLFLENAETIRALASRLRDDRDEADDIVQETFLRALLSWHTFDGHSSPRTWLFSIAYRVCLRAHRRRSGEPAVTYSIEDLLQKRGDWLVDSRVVDPAEGVYRAEMQSAIDRAIQKVPMRFRVPLVLKEIERIPLIEVARALDIKMATAKTRVHRGRFYLRAALTDAPARATGTPRRPREVCATVLQARRDCLRRGVPFCLSDDEMSRRCIRNCSVRPLRPGVCPIS
jgi:RNA polymerase sigma-70 factor (ECF subfamily)